MKTADWWRPLATGAMVRVVSCRLKGEVCLPPRAMVMSGTGCCQRPCWHPWSYSSQSLCWYPWLLLPSRAMLILGVWLPPGAMFASRGHTAAGTLQICVVFTVAWGHGDNHTQATAEGHVWVHRPNAAKRSTMSMAPVATIGHIKLIF